MSVDPDLQQFQIDPKEVEQAKRSFRRKRAAKVALLVLVAVAGYVGASAVSTWLAPVPECKCSCFCDKGAK